MSGITNSRCSVKLSVTLRNWKCRLRQKDMNYSKNRLAAPSSSAAVALSFQSFQQRLFVHSDNAALWWQCAFLINNFSYLFSDNVEISIKNFIETIQLTIDYKLFLFFTRLYKWTINAKLIHFRFYANQSIGFLV